MGLMQFNAKHGDGWFLRVEPLSRAGKGGFLLLSPEKLLIYLCRCGKVYLVYKGKNDITCYPLSCASLFKMLLASPERAKCSFNIANRQYSTEVKALTGTRRQNANRTWVLQIKQQLLCHGAPLTSSA